MKITNYLPVVLLSGALVGCKATAPAAPPQALTNMESFEIVLPKDVVGNEKTWNVDFRPFQNGNYGSSGIFDFFSVDYKADKNNSELNISACNGERYDTGRVYQSCTSYLSDIKITEKENHRVLTITPKLKSESKGGLLIPEPIPNITFDKLYGYLSSQEVTFKGNITSKFNSESIKGNFDRLMPRYSWKRGKADVAHRQFKDTYSLTLSSGESVVISAGFYPYRDGSIVEYVVKATTENNPRMRKIDWVKASKEVKDQIEKIVNS